MGLLKSLIASEAEEPGHEPPAPEEERRSAAEAALDRLIVERIAAMHGAKPAAIPAQKSTLAALSERRSGDDRREAEAAALAAEDRRTGDERRTQPFGVTGGRFRPPHDAPELRTGPIPPLPRAQPLVASVRC